MTEVTLGGLGNDLPGCANKLTLQGILSSIFGLTVSYLTLLVSIL
jgi:hypothetical protein